MTSVDATAASRTASDRRDERNRPTDWLVVLGILATTQAVSAALLLVAGRHQQATDQFVGSPVWGGYYVFDATPAGPGYLDVVTNWDGQWYERIATLGYLSSSSDPVGYAERAWSFLPAYPLTVGSVAQVLHTGVPLAASLVSLTFAGLAMCLLFALTRPHLGRHGAFGLVALTCCFVTAPLLQTAYSESMALCFLLWSLLDLRHRRYGRSIVPLVLLALTRSITPPLAAVAVLHHLARRRSRDTLGRREAVLLVAYGALALAGPFLWSTLAVRLDGSASVDRAAATIARNSSWFSTFWSLEPWSVLLPAAFAVWVARLAWTERHRLGVELAAWAALYPAFVLAATPPTPGILRYYLLGFFPGFAAIAGARTPRGRLVGVLVACAAMLVLQYLWLRHAFVVDPRPGEVGLHP